METVDILQAVAQPTPVFSEAMVLRALWEASVANKNLLSLGLKLFEISNINLLKYVEISKYNFSFEP